MKLNELIYSGLASHDLPKNGIRPYHKDFS